MKKTTWSGWQMKKIHCYYCRKISMKMFVLKPLGVENYVILQKCKMMVRCIERVYWVKKVNDASPAYTKHSVNIIYFFLGYTPRLSRSHLIDNTMTSSVWPPNNLLTAGHNYIRVFLIFLLSLWMSDFNHAKGKTWHQSARFENSWPPLCQIWIFSLTWSNESR